MRPSPCCASVRPLAGHMSLRGVLIYWEMEIRSKRDTRVARYRKRRMQKSRLMHLPYHSASAQIKVRGVSLSQFMRFSHSSIPERQDHAARSQTAGILINENTRLTERFPQVKRFKLAGKARYDWKCAGEKGKRRRTHTIDHADRKRRLSGEVGSGRPLGNTERHCAGAAGPEHSAGVRYRRRRRRIPGG